MQAGVESWERQAVGLGRSVKHKLESSTLVPISHANVVFVRIVCSMPFFRLPTVPVPKQTHL